MIGVLGTDEKTSQRIVEFISELESGGRSLEAAVDEMSKLTPETIARSIMESSLVAGKAIDDLENGIISIEEAEEIVHAQADLHPAVPIFYELCSMLAERQGGEDDVIGYTALATRAAGLLDGELGTAFPSDGVSAEVRAVSNAISTLITFRPYIDKWCGHLISHLLVYDITTAEDYLDEEELDMLLSRAEAATPVLVGMAGDIISHVKVVHPPPGLVDLIGIIGHLRAIEGLPPLIQALLYCKGDPLDEAVFALVKLGSEHAGEVSSELKRIARNPDFGEARLPAIEVLGYLHREPGNVDFLVETLESLDPDDECFYILFTFLSILLSRSGNALAAGVLDSQWEKWREQFPEPEIREMEKNLESFKHAGTYGLKEILGEDIREVCCGTMDRLTDDRRVTMTLLDEVFAEYDLASGIGPETDEMAAEEVREWLKTGRNEPCPCGSGKKFKKCCLDRIEEARASAASAPEEDGERWLTTYERLMLELIRFSDAPHILAEKEPAKEEFLAATGRERLAKSEMPGKPSLEEDIFLDWFLIDRPLECTGRRIVEEFEEERGAEFTRGTREAIDALKDCRFSMYEVFFVHHGWGMTLEDGFRREIINVVDEERSKDVEPRDLLCARLWRLDDFNEIIGSVFIVRREYKSVMTKYVRSMSRSLVKKKQVGSIDEFLNLKGYMLFHHLHTLHERGLSSDTLAAGEERSGPGREPEDEATGGNAFGRESEVAETGEAASMDFKRVYQFRVDLKDVRPPVWRRIQVPESYTFWDLHVAIQDAMGWMDCHFHEFEVYDPSARHDVRIGIPDESGLSAYEVISGRERKIADLFNANNNRARYTYDFGDDWLHTVVLEKIIPREKGVQYPVCIKGKRACPPEDCGGVYGYEEFLEIIGDPDNEEHEEMLDWVGGEFDPEDFNIRDVRFRDPDKYFKEPFRFG